MEPTLVIRENWLTRKPNRHAFDSTLFFALLLLILSFIFLNGNWNADMWMPASKDSVFQQHQYWKAWTTLFAHGDWGHFASNTLLFLPLSYLLASYFGWMLFPFSAFFLGGITNLIVLRTMPEHVSLIGISGVVYWMGAVWLTLYILVDRREKLRRRLATAIFISVMLFVPESYKPEISYLSHFIGYLLGIASGLFFYLVNRRKFMAAEVKEWIYDDPEEFPFFIQATVPTSPDEDPNR